jgi:hypothetical protein
MHTAWRIDFRTAKFKAELEIYQAQHAQALEGLDQLDARNRLLMQEYNRNIGSMQVLRQTADVAAQRSENLSMHHQCFLENAQADAEKERVAREEEAQAAAEEEIVARAEEARYAERVQREKREQAELDARNKNDHAERPENSPKKRGKRAPEDRIHLNIGDYKEGRDLVKEMKTIFQERLVYTTGNKLLVSDVLDLFVKSRDHTSDLEINLFKRHSKKLLMAAWPEATYRMLNNKRCYMHVRVKPALD